MVVLGGRAVSYDRGTPVAWWHLYHAPQAWATLPVVTAKWLSSHTPLHTDRWLSVSARAAAVPPHNAAFRAAAQHFFAWFFSDLPFRRQPYVESQPWFVQLKDSGLGGIPREQKTLKRHLP